MPPKPNSQQPVQPVAQQVLPTQQSQFQAQQKPSFYRQYWPFGLIFIFLPFGLIFGIIVLLTGDVYKIKDSTYTPISKTEKTTLLVLAFAIQAYSLLRVLT